MPKPLDLYGHVERETLDGRALEASVIERATQRLLAAKEAMAGPEGAAMLGEALKFNQKLWTFFQSEIESEDNPMPFELKRNLLALIEFIDRRTFMILADPAPAPERLDVLININRMIAAGLLEQAGGEDAA